MADIDVVKKGSNTWMFVLIALVLLALIIWFVMGAGNDAPQTGLLLDTSGIADALSARVA